MCLAVVLRNFRLRLVEGQAHPQREMGATVHPNYKLELRVEARE